MNCSLLCTYNKRNKVFSWKNINKEFTDVDGLFQEILLYTRTDNNRKNIVTGYEACNRYIDHLKDKFSNDIELQKQDFEVFLGFKSHVKDIVEYIYTKNFVVTSSSLCNNYLRVFKQCKMMYDNKSIDFKKFLDLIDFLHMQEKDILSKAYGLRIIKNAK